MMDYLNPFGKIIDVIGKAVPDKDLREQLTAELKKSEDAMRVAALNAKTVPWVDAFYKIAPMLGAAAHTVVCVGLIVWNPQIDPLLLGALGAPGGLVALRQVLKR